MVGIAFQIVQAEAFSILCHLGTQSSWGHKINRTLKKHCNIAFFVGILYALQAKPMDVWHAWAICRTWTLVTLGTFAILTAISLQHMSWISRQCVSFDYWRCWHLWQAPYLPYLWASPLAYTWRSRGCDCCQDLKCISKANRRQWCRFKTSSHCVGWHCWKHSHDMWNVWAQILL